MRTRCQSASDWVTRNVARMASLFTGFASPAIPETTGARFMQSVAGATGCARHFLHSANSKSLAEASVFFYNIGK